MKVFLMIYREEIIFGADDSNHAGTAKGEINVVVSSFLKADGIVAHFPNRRNFELTKTWLENSQRDYLFAILVGESYRHSPANLVYSAPRLIEKFLEENDIYAGKLKIFLDGFLKKEGKDEVREFLIGKRGVEQVVVDNFTKKTKFYNGRIAKHIMSPAVLYHADVISNMLYSTITTEELLAHEKLRSFAG